MAVAVAVALAPDAFGVVGTIGGAYAIVAFSGEKCAGIVVVRMLIFLHPVTIMARRRALSPVVAGAVLASLVTVALLLHKDRTADARNAVRLATPLEQAPVSASESAIRDSDVAFYTRRTIEDTASATDRFTLAGMLYARSRATGSQGDLKRAESLALQSSSLRTQRNSQALALLASIRMARHDFTGARDVAMRADSIDPNTAPHLALLGEIELELGDYAAAAAHFTAVNVGTQQFTIGARLARWYELTGRIDLARQYLTRSIAEVDQRDDLPREQRAWFHYRLGELELRAGNVAAAEKAFRAGLALKSDDIRVLGGLARAALARGSAGDAIEFGERATFIQLDPATLGTVSLGYAMRGDSVQAASYAHAMSVSALQQPGAIHRAWGLFLLDHGTAADRRTVLARARQDLRVRKDVYGHDLVAWALYRNGQRDAARAEMRLAMAQGTQDVMLTAHAKAIGLDASASTRN